MCLLHAVNTLYPNRVHAVHVMHNIRKNEQHIDKDIVQNFCSDNDIPLEVIEINHDMKLLSEEVLREKRFESLFSFCSNKNGILLTGHTASDVVETFLFRLCRGTGVIGASPFDSKTIIRPLISVSRQDVLTYNAKHSVPYTNDSTNFVSDYSRTHVRNTVLPVMRALNTNTDHNILQFLRILNAYEKHLDTQFAPQIACNTLEISVLQSLDDMICVHILQKWLKHNNIFWHNAGFDRWHNLVTWVKQSKSGSSFRLTDAVVLQHEYELVRISNETDFEKPLESIELQEGNNDFGYYTIALSFPKENGKSTKNSVFLELPVNSFPLRARTRRKGDSLVPHNGPGTVTVKKLFINEKTPKHKRNRIPIIVDNNDKILWVCGLRYATMPSTQNSIRINLTIYEEEAKL